MNRSLIPKNLLRSPFFSVPTFFDELEEFPSVSGDTGLTISEDEKNVFIEAALPGLTNDEIEVTIDNGVLFVRGEKTEDEEDKKRKFHRRATSSFSYRVAIPGHVDETVDPDAKYENGVLKLTFAKNLRGQSRRITIK